jgi:hypothetical protein
MDPNSLLVLIDSSIDKIYSAAAHFGVTLAISKDKIKDQVRQAAFSKEKALASVYFFTHIESADPVKMAHFKEMLKKIIQDIIKILNGYGHGLNSKAIVQAIATSVQVESFENASVNSLGSVPSGRLIDGKRRRNTKATSLLKLIRRVT